MYHLLVHTPEANISRAMRNLRLYRRFVSVDDDKKVEEIMARKKWPSLLGPQDFIDWVKITYRDLKGSDEMPQIKELYPDFEIIISSVCDFYDVKREKLLYPKEEPLMNQDVRRSI